MYTPNSMWTWAFIGIIVVQLGIVLGFESYVFGRFIESLTPPSFDPDGTTSGPWVYTRTIPTFLTLYIFGMLYQLILAWDALRLKNTIQIIGLCAYNLGLMLYGAVQIDEIRTATEELAPTEDDPGIWLQIRPFLVALPCVLGLGTLLLSFVAWKLYDEFAWTIYKHISADVRMKRRYLTFQIYIALLKFDFFFFLGFAIQFLVVVTYAYDAEFGLTIAAVPITIILLLLAALWVRQENKLGTLFTLVVYVAGCAYYIFKLVRIYNGNKVPQYMPVRRPLTTFAVLTLILVVLTIINAIACYRNFGQGLKPYIAKRKVESEDEKGYVVEMPNLSHAQPLPSRMTID